jgi:ATP-binding cassette, subfamily B, bacterial
VKTWLFTWRLLVGIGRETGPAVCLLYVVVSATSFVAPLLLSIGLRPLVNGAAYHDSGQVTVGVTISAAALSLIVLAPVGYRWATIRMRERSTMVMQRRLLALSTAAPRLEHFERPEFWDRLQLLKRSSEVLANGMTLIILVPLVVAQLAVTAVLLGGLQPMLLLVPLVAIPASWLSRRAETLRRRAELRTAESHRTAQHLFELAVTAASGKEVRLYGLRQELIDRHRRASQGVHRETEAAQWRSVAATAGSWLLFAVVYVGAILLVLREAAAQRATPGDVALTLALAAAVISTVGRLAEVAGSALRVRTAAEHYHWLARQATPGRRVERLAPPTRLTSGIELVDVGFTYAGSDRRCLSGVSLRLPAGSVVAVVGENGAGKSTLVKLLCGMYAPTEGSVLIDGVDLAELDVERYRRHLTAGFQDFMRFELPVREAVGLGDLGEDHQIDDEAVRAALAKAGADFVAGMPENLVTQLGPSWDGGVDLSGGQWQKLALARAMLRPAPLLVVLDEPAASLDPQTEHALFEQVAADSRSGRADGRITLLISHRFSTVRMADLIVVLEKGRVTQQGTHDELLAQGGLYAELYELQARAYR